MLFYGELFQATEESRYLDETVAGARDLAARLRGPEARTAFAGERAGLYTGLAGVVHVLDCVHRAGGPAQLGDAARAALSLVLELQRPDGAWSESNDIISGTAGIGLTLLWAARALGDARALPAAVRAGDRLLQTTLDRPGGWSWEISPTVPRRYPNFSHGAGGVAYYLASLYGAIGERRFLDGAMKGATYLQSIATATAGGGRMIFHSEPGNERLFYLSWCHGPSGTARLFHRLGDVTGDCGNCGVAEYFLALHDRTREVPDLEYARRVLDDVLSRATAEDGGLKWVQAEHRVGPELLVAQTGLMQGAAGVGLAMLHLDGALSGRRPAVVLPDSPYFARA